MEYTNNFIFSENGTESCSNQPFKETYLLYKDDLFLKELLAIERLSISTGLSINTINKIV